MAQGEKLKRNKEQLELLIASKGGIKSDELANANSDAPPFTTTNGPGGNKLLMVN